MSSTVLSRDPKASQPCDGVGCSPTCVYPQFQGPQLLQWDACSSTNSLSSLHQANIVLNSGLRPNSIQSFLNWVPDTDVQVPGFITADGALVHDFVQCVSIFSFFLCLFSPIKHERLRSVRSLVLSMAANHSWSVPESLKTTWIQWIQLINQSIIYF